MKTWIFKDTDGNLPTKDEADQFKRWFTRADSHPIVNSAMANDDNGKTIKCTWSFEETDGRPTIANLSADNSRLAVMVKELRTYMEAIKAAVAAKDMPVARKLLGIKKDK